MKLVDRMLKGGDDDKVVVKMHKKWNFSVTSCQDGQTFPETY